MASWWRGRPRRHPWAAPLAALVLLALSLRAHNLGWPPLWTDEAESSINALTIVAEGVPTDRHLGLPLYENALVRPWPESAEYEFRDISYSDRGLAVYHGWIPLYAIAAAFRLAGVTPEQARRTTPPRDAGVDELAWWTAVPRWPALAFSVIFVLAAFALGRATGGDSAGFAFAFGGSVANAFVWWGRQARYYSATLAGSALSGLLVWRAVVRGRLADHVLAGLGVGLLFHVHALSAVTMALVYVAALPLALKQPRLWLRVFVAGSAGGTRRAALGVLVGPDRSHRAPAGGPAVPRPRPARGVVADDQPGRARCRRLRHHLVGRRPRSWRPARRALAPPHPRAGAPSGLRARVAAARLRRLRRARPGGELLRGRLQLAVAVPGLLLAALVFTAAGRALRPSWQLLPILGMVSMLALAGQLPPRLAGAPDADFAALVARVRSLDVGDGGRLFASPDAHFVLRYYSGRPVQSVAPVRREWLESFRRPLAVIEGCAYESMGAEEAAAGRPASGHRALAGAGP